MKKAIIILSVILMAAMPNVALAAPNNFIEVHPENEDYLAWWGATFATLPGMTLAFMNVFNGASFDNPAMTGEIRMTRSYDSGLTFEQEQLVVPDPYYGCAIMPSPVYDPLTKKVYLLYSHYGSSDLNLPQIKVIESNEIIDIHAPITFSTPKTIPTGKQYPLLSAAAGIATSRGTLVIPFAYWDRWNYYVSSVLIFDGANWSVGGKIDFATPTGNGIDEPAIVELSNGDLLAYVRTNQYYIGESSSSDGGWNWSPVTPTNFQAIGGGFRGEQVELRRVGNSVLMAYSGDSEETVGIGKLYMSDDDTATWSAPVELFPGDSPTITKSFFHIGQTGLKTAVISWFENNSNDTWKGSTYSFSLDYTILRIPVPKKGDREWWPQPVLDDPIEVR